MRYLIALLLSLTLVPIAANAAGSGPSGIQSALPHSARLLSERALPGYRQGYAVAFRNGKPYLGVVLRGKLIWKRRLPAAPTSLATPGPTGIFEAVSKLRNNAGQRLDALRVTHGHVVSAIQRQSAGMLTADEHITLQGASFLVREHDVAHVGSVRYRLNTPYTLCGQLFCGGTTTRAPDYSPADYPRPNGLVTTKRGDVILMRLEVAADQASQEYGLMNRKTLDADSGMVFVWDKPVHESFWMENTYIPLTVAFLAPDGTVQEMQDMAPLSTELHTPLFPYQYAIEMNQGFFASAGIEVGDKVKLTLTQ